MFGVVVSVLAVVHEKIEQLPTTRNNMQQGIQHATCNIQQCWELLADKVASVNIGQEFTLSRKAP